MKVHLPRDGRGTRARARIRKPRLLGNRRRDRDRDTSVESAGSARTSHTRSAERSFLGASDSASRWCSRARMSSGV